MAWHSDRGHAFHQFRFRVDRRATARNPVGPNESLWLNMDLGRLFVAAGAANDSTALASGFAGPGNARILAFATPANHVHFLFAALKPTDFSAALGAAAVGAAFIARVCGNRHRIRGNDH